MNKIDLGKGKYAIVDNQDFKWLNQWKWCYSATTDSAIRRDYSGDKPKMISMYRQIMNAPPNQQIDHINHDRLDNRRSNLRFCSSTQNRANDPLRRDNKSGYKGVWWSTYHGRWRAEIHMGYKKYHLGSFNSPEEAHKAYVTAAKKYFGEFANV